MSERAHKRTVADRSNPLDHKGILQLVVDYVGVGEHLFLSMVSKGFRACYLNVPVYEGRVWRVEPQMTVCTAIMRSLSRLRLAVELGFKLDPQNTRLQFCAGRAADIETLIELNEQYHMPYTEQVARGAAAAGSEQAAMASR
eukprot:21454-Heterococcus_DN1.PRE.2